MGRVLYNVFERMTGHKPQRTWLVERMGQPVIRMWAKAADKEYGLTVVF